jgi:hypothetical protein
LFPWGVSDLIATESLFLLNLMFLASIIAKAALMIFFLFFGKAHVATQIFKVLNVLFALRS